MWTSFYKNIIWQAFNNQNFKANLGYAKWGMGVKEGEKVDLLHTRKLMKWGKRKEGKDQTTGKEAKVWAVRTMDNGDWSSFFPPVYRFQQFYWGINKLHIYKIYSLISFDISNPWNHQDNRGRETTHFFLISSLHPSLTSSQPYTNTAPPFHHCSLTFNKILHKWTHLVCSFCLASFTQHNYFNICPCCACINMWSF